MMTSSIEDRVFSAAELISFECQPTVELVQRWTGVGAVDAERYLKAWEQAQMTTQRGA